MSKTLKFRRQPIRKHFNVLTACLKVLLNWILFRLKMGTFSFNPTYVSVFSLWVKSLLFLIPSIKCHFDVIYISSKALRANTHRGRPDDMTDSGWVSNSMSSELDLTEFNLESNGNWVVRFGARIVIIRQDWKLIRDADIIEEVALSLCNLVQLVQFPASVV